MQEEIKITGVTVFVNPYSEPNEEEEEEKAKDEKNVEDEENVSFWSLYFQSTCIFHFSLFIFYFYVLISFVFWSRKKLGRGIAIQVQEQRILELVVVALEST